MAAASTGKITVTRRILSSLWDKLFNHCKDNKIKEFIIYIGQIIDDNGINYAIDIYNFVLKGYNDMYSEAELYTTGKNNQRYFLANYAQDKVSAFLNQIKFQDEKKEIKNKSNNTISKNAIKEDIISIIHRICLLIQNMEIIEQYIQSGHAAYAIQNQYNLTKTPFRPLALSKTNALPATAAALPPPSRSYLGSLQLGRRPAAADAAAAAAAAGPRTNIHVPEGHKGVGLIRLGIYGGRKTRKHKRRSRHTRRH